MADLGAQLVALVERWEPDFGDRIEGATPEQLDAIRAGLGELLPEHEAYLARMGADCGGLNAYGEGLDLGAEALVEFLAEDHGFDPRALAIVGVSRELAIPLLMFDRRTGAEPTPLVRVGFGDGQRPALTAEHSSLAAMLGVFAFLTKCLPRFGWELHLESPGTRRPQFPDCPPGRWLPRLAWIAAELGFRPIADLGPWALCAEKDGAALMIYECPGFTPDIRVAADARVELVSLSEILIDNLELRARPNSLRTPD